jgi:hypothetical protein
MITWRMTMKTLKSAAVLGAGLILALLIPSSAECGQEKAGNAIMSLVPEVEAWGPPEELQSYFPESLFEYINGAAESYLSYDFEELLVAQYERKASEEMLTLEIYDMGSSLNAFGIFSAERYPENESVSAGDLGYIESEALNFVSDRYYVKLLGFGSGEETESVLLSFAKGVASRVKSDGSLPLLIELFPARNLVPRSEKFIKKNFMGYEFLSNGYIASYRVGEREIECFLVEAESEENAKSMEGRLLEFFAKDKQAPEKIPLGYHLKNRYGQNLYLGRAANILFGVRRVPEEMKAEGMRYLQELGNALKKRSDRNR